MNKLRQIDKNEALQLSLKDYFKLIEREVGKDMNLEEVTSFFSTTAFKETKPYLIRRQLIPIDKRFSQIEIVHTDDKKVKAIVWNVIIDLKQLKGIFGEPIVHNEPYSNSTAFAFKSVNPEIEIIKTRHPKWLTKLKDSEEFEYVNEEKAKVYLENPEFTFIQFNIKE